MFKKIKAFTLAEMLIVLAIIGVVAALTIPAIISNYQKNQQVVALKKAYSQISQSIQRSMMESNVENFNEEVLLHGENANPKEFFKKYFNVTKYCDKDNHSLCFPTVTSIDKSTSSDIASKFDYCAVIKDGSSICVQNVGENGSPITFYVDTNGLEKPNVAGRDVFSFSVYHDGSVDEINPDSRDAGEGSSRESRKEDCEASSYASGCFSRILDDKWKMDY